jgi:ArsR family transcriptional regulator
MDYNSPCDESFFGGTAMEDAVNPQPPLARSTGYDLPSFMSIARALADEGRVRIILALQYAELCVCQIVELLQLAPSTISKHMAILRQARLVRARKRGRWVYYRLEPAGNPLAAKVLTWMSESLRQLPELTEDRERLKEILSTGPETLCRLQKSAPRGRRDKK